MTKDKAASCWIASFATLVESSASGTQHAPTFRRINEMLDGLWERGRIDLLRALRDGQLSPLQLWDAYRVGELERLPAPESLRPLDAAWRTWLDSLEVQDDVSAKDKESLETSRRYLERANARANVADLPALVEQLRGTLGKEPRRSFNLLRSAALAFLCDTLKHRIRCGWPLPPSSRSRCASVAAGIRSRRMSYARSSRSPRRTRLTRSCGAWRAPEWAQASIGAAGICKAIGFTSRAPSARVVCVTCR